MKELLLILLGIVIWQLVVLIAILVTDEDEEKVFGIGMGVVGWLIYGIIFIIAKITKCYTKENQAKRIVKSAKRQLKKSKKNWLKWYKKYGKYSNNAWNIVRKEYTEIIEQMRATGFDYNNSKEVM